MEKLYFVLLYFIPDHSKSLSLPATKVTEKSCLINFMEYYVEIFFLPARVENTL